MVYGLVGVVLDVWIGEGVVYFRLIDNWIGW